MNYRFASQKDAAVLAPLNQELIRDEGHRNPMNLAQLNERLVGWLASDYRAVIFEDGPLVVGYALFRHEPEYVYLRQLFVLPSHRRKGIGRAALQWLWANAWVGVERLRHRVHSRSCAVSRRSAKVAAAGYSEGSASVTDDAKARAAITELDQADEALFQRMHAALGRLHPEQDKFVFAGIGPGQSAAAVVSVSKLLERIDALDNSAERASTRKADHAALATLAQRGIDAAAFDKLRELVAIAQSATPVENPDAIARDSE